MSMGVVLKQVRDHLRNSMSLGVDQCGIAPGGSPPETAAEFYIAIDESQVRSTARDHLNEVYEIEIAVWRRPGQFPADQQGDLTLADDPYLAGILTLDDLERAVIRNIHANYADVTAAANTAIGAPSEQAGDVFQLAMYYAGRAGTEVIKHETGRDAAWFGRRLKFAGMNRVQSLSAM